MELNAGTSSKFGGLVLSGTNQSNKKIFVLQMTRISWRLGLLLVLFFLGRDPAVAGEQLLVVRDTEESSLTPSTNNAPALRHLALDRRKRVKWSRCIPFLLLAGLILWLIRETKSHKTAKQELKDVEDRINIISDYASDWESWLGAEGRLRHVNPAVEQLCGYSVQECRGTENYPLPFIEESHLDAFESLLEKAQKGEAVDDLPLPIRHKNGSLVWMAVSSIPVITPAGKYLGVRICAHDIIERKEMEALVQKKENIFRKILNASQAGIIVLDAKTRKAIECNQASLDLTGFCREEMIDTVCSDTFCYTGCKNCPVQGEAPGAYTFEKNIRRKDGTAMPAIKTVRLDNFDGREVLIESFVDATQLHKAIGKAEAANHAKSRFLANMSHEIRTPMNAVLGYTQVLERDPDLSPQQREYIGTIHRSGNHLLTLIDEILEFSSIEEGHVEIKHASFDFLALLDDLEQMFRMKIKEKCLQLNISRGGELPHYLLSDADKILQVLINLLGNAVKFTDKGGISVRVQCEELREEAGHSQGSLRVCIEVQDTGCGIPASDLPLLYDAFEQSVAGRNRGGSGLGMTISRQYARLLGGDITASSQEGVGSTFRFFFVAQPGLLVDTTCKMPSRRVVGIAPETKQYSILIVDDHKDNRTVLGAMLSSVGFCVDMAEDGEQALESFQRRKHDLVLMDRRLPGMDGLETVQKLRAFPDGSRIGILMVSASTLAEDHMKAAAVGVDGYLHKPLRECDLFDQVQSLLDIEYVYEETFLPRKQQPMALTQKDVLVSLPRESIFALHNAVEAGDTAEFQKILGNLPESATAVASEFRRLIRKYEYERIMELLAVADR
jgi:PAS domain S-box-containing protein